MKFSMIALSAFALFSATATIGHAKVETFVNVASQNRITNVSGPKWTPDIQCRLGYTLYLAPDANSLSSIQCHPTDGFGAAVRETNLMIDLNDPREGTLNSRLEKLSKNPANYMSPLHMATLTSPVGMIGSIYIPSGTLREGLGGELPLRIELNRARLALSPEELARLSSQSEDDVRRQIEARTAQKGVIVLGYISGVDYGASVNITMKKALVSATQDSRTFLVNAKSVEFDWGYGLSQTGRSELINAVSDQNSIEFKNALNKIDRAHAIGLNFTPYRYVPAPASY